MSDGDNATPGQHREGVTVADLIAKVSGAAPLAEPTRHRVEPDARVVAEAASAALPAPEESAPDESADHTAPIPVPAAYAE